MKRLKRILRPLVHMKPDRDNFEIYPEDAFLVSYPKSGNTWVRFLLAHLMAGGSSLSFDKVQCAIPDLHRVNLMVLPKYRGRIFKTHTYYHPAYNKVIHIVRDPRSVVVSCWHYWRMRGRISEDTSLSDYVGIFTDSIDIHGGWLRHTLSWYKCREGTPHYMFIRYEDIKSNPNRSLRLMADFLGIEHHDQSISKSVELSRLDNLKQIENANSIVKKKGNKNERFFREGTTQGWSRELTDLDVAKIFDYAGEYMKVFRYE